MRHISAMRPFSIVSLVLAAALAIAAGTAAAQRGQGRGRMMHDADHQADMRGFHELLDQRANIVRTVTLRPDGIETLTESAVPAVAELIYTHVKAMAARVDEQRPIHQRDPLFREIFRHASQIDVRYERTARGVRVVETSSDPYVAKLIQAHASVVSAFLANGHAEMMKDHPLPEAPAAP
jgi:hypothetical protein